MRNFWIIVVLLLWAILASKMCSDFTACCTDDDSEEVVMNEEKSPMIASVDCDGVICFADNECEPILGKHFQSFKDSLLALISDDHQLSISGIYNTSESYTGISENLGTCRAAAIAALLGLSADQINVKGQVTVGREVGLAERYDLDLTLRKTDMSPESSPSISGEAVIYFPYNSTTKLDDGDIESYLNQVANNIKNAGGKIKLIGHTDSRGEESQNELLGQRRANVIADHLYGQGLLRDQVITESKGESEPVATNATEVGRAKNRRVELQIIR